MKIPLAGRFLGHIMCVLVLWQDVDQVWMVDQKHLIKEPVRCSHSSVPIFLRSRPAVGMHALRGSIAVSHNLNLAGL